MKTLQSKITDTQKYPIDFSEFEKKVNQFYKAIRIPYELHLKDNIEYRLYEAENHQFYWFDMLQSDDHDDELSSFFNKYFELNIHYVDKKILRSYDKDIRQGHDESILLLIAGKNFLYLALAKALIQFQGKVTEDVSLLKENEGDIKGSEYKLFSELLSKYDGLISENKDILYSSPDIFVDSKFVEASKLLNRAVTNKKILDACCGSRMFWFDKTNPDVLFADIRDEELTLCDGSLLKIKPDVQMDFKKMPFQDNTFKMVVFDPPHIQGLSPNCLMGQKYGTLHPTWRTDLKDGFNECMRVLNPEGFLIFKWNEAKVTLNEVLRIFPKQPLFGHTTGKQGRTIWVCFMKDPEANKKR